ncbi:Haloacid dehalogenase-like hydrolase [Winogradskyella psychrotolerans RS-3]|uniref:Haloacid dehalogenase-like hydrolase n=1 Tax=Winogradskyella psychrotolerans RS-3 TaxID=641526 RepID=S7VL32_9FLAO|nr:HAD family phosphatase [Winogradskyella psychrotolerans]EPR70646.1 Haloacid dehalogenase-like hydrolase [Winogradskyella psychrotolerans RS-3]
MQKIKTLIFDFGDVFINLDKQGAMQNALNLFNIDIFDADTIETNELYEVGKISTAEFIQFYKTKFSKISETNLIDAWNYILKDFPNHRLDFIKDLARQKDYKLILLSNTNDMHIDFIKANVPFFEDFKNCFDKFYLSQEIQLRKPNTDIFEFVLKQNNLIANECLFIDDTKANTDTAKSMGFHTWNIDETKEDITTLFETNKELF